MKPNSHPCSKMDNSVYWRKDKKDNVRDVVLFYDDW
jgi:hypothetical protein